MHFTDLIKLSNKDTKVIKEGSVEEFKLSNLKDLDLEKIDQIQSDSSFIIKTPKKNDLSRYLSS